MNILFQGDSITDAGRGNGLGSGYPVLCSAYLGAKYPAQHTFINRGISGNRIVDVYARIKVDGWNLEPDVFSLLIGINDVWHEVGGKNGVDAERFYRMTKMLVEDTLHALPGVRMILMEPFVLPGTATSGAWETFGTETALRAKAVRDIAAECGQIFIPLQDMFDAALADAPADYWLFDGVHPTAAGHQLIANRWISAFESEIL